jgi:hypothetical protein
MSAILLAMPSLFQISEDLATAAEEILNAQPLPTMHAGIDVAMERLPFVDAATAL